MILAIILYSSLTIIFAYSAYSIYKLSLKLAKWARKNKTQARWMLVAFNLAMAMIGVSIGLLCAQLDLHLSVYAIYIGLALFMVGTLLFPSNSKASSDIAGRYRKKQILSTFRIGGSSLAMIAFANEFFASSGDALVTSAGISPVVLIIIASFGLIIFGSMVLVLSCGLACNGYDAAAVLVLVGGTGGLIALYVFVIRKIIRREKEELNKRSSRNTNQGILDDDLASF